MSIKTDLYTLIERLNEADAARALAFVQQLLAYDGPTQSLFDPPSDNEPESDEERALVAQGKADLVRGDVVPGAEIFRRYGV